MANSVNTDARALPKGTQLSDYRLEHVLGHGGFGITYLATDLSLNKKVAIKEYYPREIAVRNRTKAVHPTGSAEDRDNFSWGLERFGEEARTLARFSHQNVVAVRRLFEANGTSYIVMDFCEGEPLSQIIRRHAPLPQDELESLFASLLDALEHVHSAGVMHRDIKPANIFIRADGSPILLDFGAARQALVNHSQSMTSLATAHYAAFEQYSTHGDQGAWTDIYGLAATCYHAATGEKPFDAPDRILDDKLEPLITKAAGQYTHEFLRAIDAGLAVRPKDRPQTIGEWRDIYRSTKPSVSSESTPARYGGGENTPDYTPAVVGIVLSFLLIIGIAFANMDSSPMADDIATTEATTEAAPEVVEASTPEASPLDAAVAEALAAQAKAKVAAQRQSCPDDLEVIWDECEGTYVAEDGTTSAGYWRNNKLSGYGVTTLSDGDRYEGQFVDNLREGYGVYTFSDGERWEGRWGKGNLNGQARILDPRGNIIESGRYKNDKLQ